MIYFGLMTTIVIILWLGIEILIGFITDDKAHLSFKLLFIGLTLSTLMFLIFIT